MDEWNASVLLLLKLEYFAILNPIQYSLNPCERDQSCESPLGEAKGGHVVDVGKNIPLLAKSGRKQ